MVIDKQELLSWQFQSGSRVINCIQHASRDITERPDDCRLCLSDLRNHMNHAISVNKWLNEWKDDATQLLGVFDELSVEDK